MKKRGLNLFFIVLVVAVLPMVGAVSFSLEDVGAGLKKLTINDAEDVYAYEVNFSIDSGEIEDVVSANFLGPTSEATYGDNEREGYLYVYGSRLDSSATGVDGDGDIANISLTGEITLRGHTIVYANGSESSFCYGDDCEDEDDGEPTPGEDDDESSSGGGAGVPTQTPEEVIIRNIVANPGAMTINVVEGARETRTVVLRNRGDTTVTFLLTTEGLGNAITFEERTITLARDEEREVSFDIFVDERGLSVGRILMKEGSTNIGEIPVILNVRTENFLFDVKVSIPLQFRRIEIGDNVMIDIDLSQVGIEENVDVVANYIIKDFAGNTYLEESETFSVLSEKRLTKELLASNLAPGKYAVSLELIYPGAFAVSSAQFEVVERGGFSFTSREIIIGAAAFMIAVVLVVSIWALRSGRKTGIRRR